MLSARISVGKSAEGYTNAEYSLFENKFLTIWNASLNSNVSLSDCLIVNGLVLRTVSVSVCESGNVKDLVPVAVAILGIHVAVTISS
jgi:hypothetical protein